MFKQSDGTPSASFTMMAVGFGLISLWLLLSILEEIAGVPIREFSGGEAMAYFTPLAMLYFGRRWTSEMGTEKANQLISSIRGSVGGGQTTPSIAPPPSETSEGSESQQK